MNFALQARPAGQAGTWGIAAHRLD
jgi:hypothetical protein